MGHGTFSPTPPRSPAVAFFNLVVTSFENALAVILVTTVVIDILLQIVFRFYLNQPLSWSGELATYILIWLTFVGLAVAQREHAHVALHIFTDIPPRVETVLRWARWIATLALFLTIGIGGLEMAITHSVERSPAMQVPVWVIYSGLPLGGLLGVWHLLLDLPSILRPEEVQP